jgi:hypothetical protein
VILIDPFSGNVKTFPEGGGAEAGQLVISNSSEKAGLLIDRRMKVVTFPKGQSWEEDVDLGVAGKIEAFSPGLEHLVAVSANNQITIRSLQPESSVVTMDAEVKGVTGVTCSSDPRTYAWGGRDGRVVVHRSANGTSSADNLAPAFDPSLGKIQLYPPKHVQLPYMDCTCTCNSVAVTSETNQRMTQVWDSERQSWLTQTLPCGSPLPPGSICVCNCVSAAASPLWNTVCTCNLVCVCNPQGSSGGYTLRYWY